MLAGMFGNFGKSQEPVMGAQGSPFAMPQQSRPMPAATPMPMPMQAMPTIHNNFVAPQPQQMQINPLMMMNAGRISQAPQPVQQPLQPPMPQPVQQPLMMMSGGQLSQAPQQMQDMVNQPGGMVFRSRFGDR